MAVEIGAMRALLSLDCAAHDKMLDAWETLTQTALRREGPTMEAKAREQGKTAHEAAQAAQEHVNALLIEMQRERARLEAQGARLQ